MYVCMYASLKGAVHTSKYWFNQAKTRQNPSNVFYIWSKSNFIFSRGLYQTPYRIWETTNQGRF